jgi:hypothetical protein
MPGILEVIAVEYYSNETRDDIENSLVDGLVLEPENPNPEEIEDMIEGPTFIKPRIEYTYYFRRRGEQAQWSIVTKHVPVEIVKKENRSITLK